MHNDGFCEAKRCNSVACPMKPNPGNGPRSVSSAPHRVLKIQQLNLNHLTGFERFTSKHARFSFSFLLTLLVSADLRLGGALH